MANDYYNPTQTAQPGTTVRSAQFNDNNAEVVAGFDKLPSPITLFSGNQNFGVDTGVTPNLYEVEIEPDTITSYTDGLVIQVRPIKNNTGSSTVDLNGLGARQIRNKIGDQLIADDIQDGVTIVLRYNSMTTFFTIDLAESTILSAVADAEQARDEAQQSAAEAAQSEQNAAQSATDAANSAIEAANSADIINGILILPVLPWVPGTFATDGFQRYEFENNLYIAPEATPTNQIPLNATPIGDANWLSWSDPIRFFAYEETTVAPKSVFNVGVFSEIADVFIDTNLQNTNAYTLNGALGTVTFTEDVPTGTYVKIWVGRIKDAFIANINNAFIQFDAGVIAAPTTVFRPGVDFIDATLFAGGVPQRPGVGYSYIIETDTLNSAFKQITFIDPIEPGIELFGTLRKEV